MLTKHYFQSILMECALWRAVRLVLYHEARFYASHISAKAVKLLFKELVKKIYLE
jgi:hypothetical protein